jgi:hypothetical protein
VYVRFPGSVNLLSVDNTTMQLIEPTFKLEGRDDIEIMPNYIRFKSNVGKNKVHRLYMGGKLMVNNSSTGTYNSGTNTIEIKIEAY